MSSVQAYQEIDVPSFVTITDTTPKGQDEPEYVICNEATGRYFLANRSTVEFYAALKDTRQVAAAIQQSRIPNNQAAGLLKHLMDNGLIVTSGETQSSGPTPMGPLESKLVSMRWDLLNIARLTNWLRPLGRFAYSKPGYVLWGIAMIAMLFELLANREKLYLTMAQAIEASLSQWLIFAAFFVGLKIVHELGHALAYQQMCIREGLEPGPIRVGLCIFAFSPFPFTDVTGAWRLKSKARRIMIGAGGIYFETWAMAALTFVWAETQSGLVQTVILQVVVIAGALALLFNLNPAIKLDGYFMLTDYLRRPNLAARAGNAARTTVARALGADLNKPRRSELFYWVLSYAYRWTIFAGIFWIFYRIDPRLAPLALIVVLMTLVIRPVINTAKFVHKSGANPWKGMTAGAVAIGVIVLCFVPFPDRLLVSGQVVKFETRFLLAPEPGRLVPNSNGWSLQNPQLDQRLKETALHQQVLENLKTANFASASEQVRYDGELSANSATFVTLTERKDRLKSPIDRTAQDVVWTGLDARWFNGSWVRPAADQKLGAVSLPSPPHLLFRLNQTRLQDDLNLQEGDTLRVRVKNNPKCEFQAQLKGEKASLIAVNSIVFFKADFDQHAQTCIADLAHGEAIVGRLSLPNRPLIERIWLSAARLLQDRLPVEQQ
jgi:hypothetical protein